MTQYNLLLIGETGSGKTSFLNLLCNCAAVQETGKKFDEIGLTNLNTTDLMFHDIKLENPDSKKMESKTSFAKMYTTKLVGLKVGVIDTPGFNDSRGFEQDKQNTDTIIKTLKESEHVNCVCLVINGRSSRIGPSLKYVLAAVTSVLPKIIVENVIVILTNSADEDDASFDVDVLQEFFQRKIPDKNIFYIDNPFCKLIKAKEKAAQESKPISGAKARNIASSFQITAGVLKDMHESIKEFQPVYTKNFIEVYEKKEEAELKVLKILTEYKEQNDLQKQIKNAELEIEAAMKSKKLYENYNTTRRFVHYDVQPIYGGQHNTLCGEADCHSNCHMPCYLEMSFEKEAFLNCRCMNGGTSCVVCGHHYTHHYHSKAKFVRRVEEKSIIDDDMKKKFTTATNTQERKDALKAGYQKKLRVSEEEKKRLSEELVQVLIEFEKCSISRNFANVLESQLELIDQHIKAEVSADTQSDSKSNLQKTRDELSKRLDIVRKALAQKY